MKEQIREVQKYFEEQISNGFYVVTKVASHGSIDIIVDEKYKFCLNICAGVVYQHSMDNFIMLECKYISPKFIIHDTEALMRRDRLRNLDVLTEGH